MIGDEPKGQKPKNPNPLQKLRASLHAKAKREPGFRFYALYDKVYRADVLQAAWEHCRKKGKGPGVDGQTFADIEAYGVERWLGEVAEELRTKRYEPSPIRRSYIPKDNGGERPLGIPTIKDRVVQTALIQIIGPIFEADFPDEQYAYREGRSALQAVELVHQLVEQGYREVVDADLSNYFDTIPHAELMQCLARRISDGAVLHLVKLWLIAPVEEKDRRGRVKRTTQNKDTKRGTPQGAPISPWLANLYMRRFVLGWKKLGYDQRFQSRIVNFADDFVILCRRSADRALIAMRDIMQRLKLTVNETKTRVCRLGTLSNQLATESFDFLRYTFGRRHSKRTGGAYWDARPARPRVHRACREISDLVDKLPTFKEPQELIQQVNYFLRGWANYFSYGTTSPAYRAVHNHTIGRVRYWLQRKFKVRGRGCGRFPDKHLVETLGLLNLAERRGSFSRAKAGSPDPKAGCGKSARPV